MNENKSQIDQDSLRAEEYFTDEINFTTNPDSLKDIIDTENQKVTIIDVRSKKAFKAGHIPGAINLPFDKHNYFDGEEKEFYGLTRENFNYIYCYSLLCKLGQRACRKFASLGYPIKEVKGGFQSWKDYGYEIEI